MRTQLTQPDFSAGVPQVVLPTWADTYDYAYRVERLGIGRYDSRKASPKYKAVELGPVLVDVILGPKAEDMREKARDVAKGCAARGEGREVTTKEIMAVLTAPHSKLCGEGLRFKSATP